MVIDEELKRLSSIPFHELVSRHINKLVHALYLTASSSLNFLLCPQSLTLQSPSRFLKSHCV